MKNAKKRGKPFSKNSQPSAASKRVKKRKTRLKEAIGMESWEAIQTYLTTKGAAKFIRSMNSQTGKSYANLFLQAMEYFKPKLARTELTGKDGKDVLFKVYQGIDADKV